jgi:hypothetical protein
MAWPYVKIQKSLINIQYSFLIGHDHPGHGHAMAWPHVKIQKSLINIQYSFFDLARSSRARPRHGVALQFVFSGHPPGVHRTSTGHSPDIHRTFTGHPPDIHRRFEGQGEK